MQNVNETIYAQFANSDRLCTIINGFNQAVDPQNRIDLFYRDVFDLNTAVGWGLDVWGRIVGVGRVIQVASGSFIGFDEADDGSHTIGGFNYGIFYNGQVTTENYALTDDAFRRLIFAKAAANISGGSIADLNAILMTLFAGSGKIWVEEKSATQMTINHDWVLSPVEAAILGQAGILCVPSTVSVNSVLVRSPDTKSDFGGDIQ